MTYQFVCANGLATSVKQKACVAFNVANGPTGSQQQFHASDGGNIGDQLSQVGVGVS